MLVCLNGHPRSGKTTIAKHLIANHGFEEISLNYPFRRFVMQCAGFGMFHYDSVKDIALPNHGGTPTTVREMMIDVANVVEKWDPSVWVRLAMEEVLSRDPLLFGRYVLDSVGKQAQMRYLKTVVPASALEAWVVNRDQDPSKSVFSDGRENLDTIEFSPRVIFNTQGLKSLYKDVDALMEKIP